MVDRHGLELAIAAQEGLRGIVPDEVIDAAVTTLRLQLAAVGEPARRRQVTVLFADVSGFTAHYEQETSLRRALGDRIGYASAVLNAAQVRLRLGDVEGSQSALVDGLAVAVAVGARRYIHFALLLEADRRLTAGDTAGALSLLGLVRTQPAADRDDRIEIDRVLSRAGLDVRTAGDRLTAGAGLDLNDVVADLLDGR